LDYLLLIFLLFASIDQCWVWMELSSKTGRYFQEFLLIFSQVYTLIPSQ
jgi:hypothetical protein